jgi:phage terminase large subunit
MNKKQPININWGKWSDHINKSFIPLVQNNDRYLILYGGRGSSKSNFASKKLIFHCITDKYFKCVLIRKTYDSIKESSFEQICQTIQAMGLSELFLITKSPMRITCRYNGNVFLARGCDDTTRIKSITDPTCIWYEEDIPTWDDFNRITTTLRTQRGDRLQELFTINPEVDGNYQDNWFWKMFFNGRSEKSFSGKIEAEVDGKKLHLNYTTHHSIYTDNRWLTPEYSIYLNSLKEENPYYYTIYCLGEWGNRSTEGLAYRKFNRAIHVNDNITYNKDLPLHISFDFNVKPYVSLSIIQFDEEIKEIKVIDGIEGRYPRNTSKDVCQDFIMKYNEHQTGLYIYGDPSGRHKDTRQEEGYDDFDIIIRELDRFRPELRVAKAHPPVKPRIGFINTIMESEYKGLKLRINPICIGLIDDFTFLRETQNGGKLKEKITKNGETYEKWGHFSDNLEYMICECFKDEFQEFMDGPKRDMRTLGNPINVKYEW